MNRRQAKSGPSSEAGESGLIHLLGMDAHDHETFCGFCGSGNAYEDTDEPADCPGCLRAVREADGIIRNWKKSEMPPVVQTLKPEDHFWCPECGLWSYDQSFWQHHTPDHTVQGANKEV